MEFTVDDKRLSEGKGHAMKRSREAQWPRSDDARQTSPEETMTVDEATEDLLNVVRALEPIIRQHADEAERSHRLSQPVVDALARAGLFRMWVPKTLGGLEVSPLTAYRVVEEVARVDGSTGWCVFIGVSSAVSGAYVADLAAEDMFTRDPLGVIGGSIAGIGKAVGQKDGGYLVSGRWPYASGCQHCGWFLALCQVMDGDQPRVTTTGAPEMRIVHIPREKVTILDDTWDVSGLVGTGSHDLVVEPTFVPEGYTWPFTPGTPRGKHYRGPLYQFPLVALFRLQASAVALGIAQGAVDAWLALAPSKRAVVAPGVLRDQPLVQARIAEVVALVKSSRAWLHAAIQQAWETTLRGESASVAARAELLLAAVNATRRAAEAVPLVYGLAGGSANYRHSSFQRSLRDVHAVTQHVGMYPQQYEEAGRMILGLQAFQPLLGF
jgi:alkylation response protein AidB-like acyl-CoA dehydrogenase